LNGSTVFSAWNNRVTRCDSTGAETDIAALAGTKKVFWAVNNKTPTADIVVVDPDNGASVVTVSAVSSYPDPDLPAVNSVAFQDGYFFFTTGHGECYASGLNSTSIDALDETGAEGKRDGLHCAVAFGGSCFAARTRLRSIKTRRSRPASRSRGRSLSRKASSALTRSRATRTDSQRGFSSSPTTYRFAP
jgi:hypothetical protein